jgi:hypothetical protein
LSGSLNGFVISSNLNPYIFTFDNWGPLVGGSWYATAGAASFQIGWYEVIYQPRRDD